MKTVYSLIIALILAACTKPQTPEELFAAARQKMKDAERVEFQQELVVEIPNMGEYDTSIRIADFRKNPDAVFGYEFIGKGDGFESWYVDRVNYNVDHSGKNVLVMEDFDTLRLQTNSFRTFNPLFLLEKDPWNYLNDTVIQGRKLHGFKWVEKDTLIDGRKIYLENRVWINPANLTPELFSRSAYQDGNRGQLIESTYHNWKLSDTAEPFVMEFPKGYLTKIEGETQSPLLKVGVQAPDFELADADGNLVKLSDFRGKKVLLDFSIINCGWCKTALVQFSKPDYEFAEDIVPLYINPTDSKEKLEKYQTKVKIPFPVLADAKQVGKDYGVYGFPTFYLINESGKVEEVTQGFYDEKILEWKKKSE